MSLAGRSRQGEALSPIDRQTLATSIRTSILLGDLDDAPDLATPEQVVAGAVDKWLATAGVRIRFSWGVDGPSLQIATGPTVLGVLGLHLATMIARSDGMWLCSGCGLPHFRLRAPKKGHPCYCTRTECKRLQNRLAQRRSRAGRKDENA